MLVELNSILVELNLILVELNSMLLYTELNISSFF